MCTLTMIKEKTKERSFKMALVQMLKYPLQKFFIYCFLGIGWQQIYEIQLGAFVHQLQHAAYDTIAIHLGTTRSHLYQSMVRICGTDGIYLTISAGVHVLCQADGISAILQNLSDHFHVDSFYHLHLEHTSDYDEELCHLSDSYRPFPSITSASVVAMSDLDVLLGVHAAMATLLLIFALSIWHLNRRLGISRPMKTTPNGG